MTTSFIPLTSMPLESGVCIHRLDRLFSDVVTMVDPAIVVMTDLRKVNAVTIEADVSIEAASKRMKQRGVRLLLVADDHDVIIGLITSTDLQGEKPLQYIQKHGGKRSDVTVGDIMTPQQNLEVLCMADVDRSKVGNVVETLKKTGRQHALVVDRLNAKQPQVLRGIFSASQIARQLDMEIQTGEIAKTFAEIETLLMSN